MSDRILDLDRYLSLPRLGDLDVSPDGRWLAFGSARVSRDGKKFVRDLWRVPTSGGPPERLTVGETAEFHPRFLADGSLLFLSARPDPEPEEDSPDPGGEPAVQLWLLPPAGEARALTRRAGSLDAFAVARSARAVVFRAPTHPGSTGTEDDRKVERERKKSGATGLAYDTLPIRFWDRFYGPRWPHLFHSPTLEAAAGARDLTPQATLEHDELAFDISPDGLLVVAGERQRDEEGRFLENLRLFDVAAGTSRLLTRDAAWYAQPRFSPDGSRLAAVFHENVPGRTGRQWLVEVALDGKTPPRPLTRDLDLWPESPTWSSDGRSLFFVADERGHHPIFEVELASGRVTRLTRSGTHADLVAGGNPCRVFVTAASFARPPDVARLEPGRADQDATPLTRLAATEIEGVALGAAESLVTKSRDGREVHSWLIRPTSPPPAGRTGHPLLLWVHGGPLGAWSDGWHWRWNPQLFAARGFAVLLVNPRISTGYGQDFIEGGHARWGAEPYEDLLAAVDHALTLPGIDPSRTAAMGGSFGGYMANWIAGHTDRFRCIVSHAGLWHLVGFHGTTDFGTEWEREFGGDPYRHPELYERWSPHHGIRDIRTPMLVVHGEKDYRVPVAEAFQLFTALQRLGVASRLLYFPDENHWILRPPNIRTWHAEVIAWLERWLG